MKRIAISSAVVLGAGMFTFVVWASNAAPPEPAAYASALAEEAVAISSHDGFITIRPAASEPSVGVLFYPGARVSPEAYVPKLAAVAVAADVQIVIGRPRLNLAVLSIDQADAMRAALPRVKRWYVGGHSLGGAMACLYASRHAESLEGVMLLGTYCGSDISGSRLRVLSVSGERDGLFPPEKLSEKRGELPKGAHFVVVPGMNHAQFGNYGPQSGDNPESISDAVARQALVNAATAFFTETAAPH